MLDSIIELVLLKETIALRYVYYCKDREMEADGVKSVAEAFICGCSYK
jgi:hypothetical protein